MKIKIIAVGKLKEAYLREGVAEYLKRLRPFADVTVNEISEAVLPHNPSVTEIKAAIADEGERLARLVPPGAYLFALDLHGKMLASVDFAAKTDEITARGNSVIAFAIGGAFGIAENITAAADFRLCLSPMTFTHQMTRLLLVEQIYRSFKINRGEKYHW